MYVELLSTLMLGRVWSTPSLSLLSSCSHSKRCVIGSELTPIDAISTSPNSKCPQPSFTYDTILADFASKPSYATGARAHVQAALACPICDTRTPDGAYPLRCSYLEIYNGGISDLLRPPIVAAANPVQIQDCVGSDVSLSPSRQGVVVILKGVGEALRRGEPRERQTLPI